MLETLAYLGEFLGGLAVILSLIYVGFQLNETRKQMKANALQQRINTRINIWTGQLEWDAYHSALDKFFEHELYKLDLQYHEIEELTLRERRALQHHLTIELVYFQNLFYQVKHNIIDEEECTPLKYMMCFNPAPARRHWKDFLRLNNHFPFEFVAHTDEIVKKYDALEDQMSADEDAEFEALFLEIFDVPPPPRWDLAGRD